MMHYHSKKDVPLVDKVTSEMRTEHYDTTGEFVTDERVLAWATSKSTKSDVGITPEYYGAKCKCGRKLDPYAIIDAYSNISSAAHQHAVKKLIRAGEGHKDLNTDIQEVIDTLLRWQEQLNDNT